MFQVGDYVGCKKKRGQSRIEAIGLPGIVTEVLVHDGAQYVHGTWWAMPSSMLRKYRNFPHYKAVNPPTGAVGLGDTF